MWPDRVSNPGPLTYESDALPTALRGPARPTVSEKHCQKSHFIASCDIHCDTSLAVSENH